MWIRSTKDAWQIARLSRIWISVTISAVHLFYPDRNPFCAIQLVGLSWEEWVLQLAITLVKCRCTVRELTSRCATFSAHVLLCKNPCCVLLPIIEPTEQDVEWKDVIRFDMKFCYSIPYSGISPSNLRLVTEFFIHHSCVRKMLLQRRSFRLRNPISLRHHIWFELLCVLTG